MSISPSSGASGLERLACSKYYSVGKTLPKMHIASKKAENLLNPIAPLLRQIDRRARRFFGTKFNFEQLLFEAFFFTWCVFLAALSPKLNIVVV